MDLQLKIPVEGKPEKPLDLVAYVFDRNGKLVSSSPVKADQVKLAVGDAQASHARVFIAPAREGFDPAKASLQDMTALKAYEPALNIQPGVLNYEIPAIPQAVWQLFPLCYCRVRARVMKSEVINGIKIQAPVCHARVHICEVDPWLILLDRLPDPHIFRLRDDLLVALNRPLIPPNPNPPDPPDLRGAGNITSLPGVMADISSLRPPATIPSAILKLKPELAAIQPLTTAALDLKIPAEIPLAAKTAFTATSVSAIKESLTAHLEIFRPYFCYIDWLWRWYRCTELRVVETDEQGRIDISLFYPCFGPRFDLYFWVEYSIGGAWTPVYRPSIGCHTFWNFACGTEVTLIVTDPRVPACRDLPSVPDEQVAVISIGRNVNVRQVITSAADQGLYPSGGLNVPFAGSLEPHVWFGTGLIPAGITHYAWSYRKLDGVDTFHRMDAPVGRNYTETVGGLFHIKNFALGPDPAVPGAAVYKIPPAVGPGNGWIPDWDPRANSASAYFLTPALNGGDPLAAAGLYEIKLELFSVAGGVATLAHLPRTTFQVPPVSATAPFGNTTPTLEIAPDVNLFPTMGDVTAFTMVIHVDNNPGTAILHPTSVGGTLEGPCGFITYGAGSDAVNLSFQASHPFNFATFSFGVYKGTSGLVSSAGGRVGFTPVGPYHTVGTTDYASDSSVTASSLLGTCTKGAFAEYLSVTPYATDGWDWDVLGIQTAIPIAFALEP